MRRLVWIVVACAPLLSACPGGGGAEVESPPPFRVGQVSPLGEPPPPAAGKEGLAYLEAVYPDIRDGWASFVNDCRLRLEPGHALNRDALAAVVSLTVRRDGTVADSALTTASGEADFDAAALEIARDRAPYPPPPAELLSDDGLLHLSWAFHRDQRLAGVATAEISRVTWEPERAIPAFLAAGALDAAAKRLAREARASGDDGAALVGLGEKLAAAAIDRALASSDAASQEAGAEAAARARLESAAPRLSELARAGEADVRRAAIDALGATGAATAIPALLEIASTEADPALVTAAMEALAKLGATDRARAALGDRLGTSPDDERLVLTVAVKVPLPGAIDGLRKLVGHSDRAIRAAACTALGRAGAESASRVSVHAALRKHLGDRDAGMRAACARGVGLAGGTNRASYWALIKLFKDRDDRVRAEAVRAAGRLEPARFDKELYNLRKESSPLVLAALADALGGATFKGALERLRQLAASEQVEVRRAAAAALAHRTEPEARTALAGLAGDPDPEVRLEAIAAVAPGELGPVLEDEDPALRTAALVRHFAASGRSASLADFADRVLTAADAAERARLAGAWLSR